MVNSVSLDIEFNDLKNNIFIASVLISTNTQLDVILRWLGQLLGEPGEVGVVTAGASGSTTLPIPERILNVVPSCEGCMACCVTIVIISNKGWDI